MKSEITSLDLHYLVREFQQLVGARIDKVYEQSEDRKEFLFVFHKTGAGKSMLRIKLPGLVYLSEYKQVFPETPPGFCVFLRKHLASARIKEIRQRGFERILEIVFDTREGDSTLICELFSKGNMILIDDELKIKGLLESQNWESRTIRGGTKYQYPPMQTNTPKLSFSEFEKIITNTSFDSVVKAFAVELSLGGAYAEELCRRTGISKDKKRLSSEELKKAFDELSNMINQAPETNISGEEVFPFVTGAEPDKRFESLSAAMDDVFSSKHIGFAEQKEQREKKTKQDKIRVVLAKQEERLRELEKGIKDNQRSGELIYEHYQEIKEVLEKINSDRKKMDWESLKKKYKDDKLIKEIDGKKGIVIVDF